MPIEPQTEARIAEIDSAIPDMTREQLTAALTELGAMRKRIRDTKNRVYGQQQRAEYNKYHGSAYHEVRDYWDVVIHDKKAIVSAFFALQQRIDAVVAKARLALSPTIPIVIPRQVTAPVTPAPTPTLKAPAFVPPSRYPTLYESQTAQLRTTAKQGASSGMPPKTGF